ncbi:MAG: 16S rRNA (cytidine(1402)-2'-O)-methyltransferase [Clostridia bacterium]|nr:16S rRNA (cytidine(1402)-2'-O)-methyltransferase [Clostridia bacterium]
MQDKGRLFLCATPIGNLKDITLRVLETLKEVDLIACEDTRQTRKLLNHFSIEKPVTSYFEHNKKYKGEKIIETLLAGKNVALVSDAGMPGVSDPGQELIQDCLKAGIEFTVLPGPVAAITGLVLSGLSTQRFAFEGFIPRTKKEKKAFFQRLISEERTLVFYEAPHRLLETLEVMEEVLGNRQMAACRELTKKFEEIMRGSIGEVYQFFKDKGIKGEFTLVVEGAPPKKEEKGLEWALNRVEELKGQGLTAKEAVKVAAKESGIGKRELYEKVMVK